MSTHHTATGDSSTPRRRRLGRGCLVVLGCAALSAPVLLIWYVGRASQQTAVVAVLKKCDAFVEYYDDFERTSSGEYTHARGRRRTLFPKFFREEYPSYCSRVFTATAFATQRKEGLTEDETRKFISVAKRLPALRHFGMKSDFFTGQQLRELPALSKLQSLYVESAEFCNSDVAAIALATDLRSLTLIAPQMTDEGLLHLNQLTRLHGLSISSPNVTDAGLAKLRLPQQIDELILSFPAVTDAGVLALPPLPNLTQLVLNDLQVQDAGVAHLVSGGKLENLRISGGNITDGCLPAIGKNVYQRFRLHLAGRPITDAGLAHLSGLIRLAAIDLSETLVTDAGLRHLQAMGALQFVDLHKTQITGAGLKHIQSAYVREIDLSDTQITDANLVHLQGKQRLQKLMLRNTPISGSGLTALQSINGLRLDLTGAAVTDNGLASLSGLRPLDSLVLSGTTIGDAGCQHFPRIDVGDRLLDLSHTKITDASIAAIIRTGTRKLVINDTAITDTGLNMLVDLLDHKYDEADISLKGTKVTSQGIRRLHDQWDASDRFGRIEHDFSDEQIWPEGRRFSDTLSDPLDIESVDGKGSSQLPSEPPSAPSSAP